MVDTRAPVITLNSGTSGEVHNPHYVVINTTYDDPGIVAVDAVDGTLSKTSPGVQPGWWSDTSDIDMTTLGDYTVTYTSNDTVGNSATATRAVKVVTGLPHFVKIRNNKIRHLFNTVCRSHISFEENGNLKFKVSEDTTSFIVANHAEGGYVGFNITDPVAPLHMNGATRFSGSFTCQELQGVSDRRLKIKIEEIDIPLAGKIHDLEPVKYNWKTNPDGSVQFGFIAQDIVDHFPNIVHVDRNGDYSLDYVQFIPLIIKELKRQMDEIDDLTQETAHISELIDAEIKKMEERGFDI